jgi:hypothetical protein
MHDPPGPKGGERGRVQSENQSRSQIAQPLAGRHETT